VAPCEQCLAATKQAVCRFPIGPGELTVARSLLPN
jgi:hypothetical protein